jgi:hypothetical protein
MPDGNGVLDRLSFELGIGTVNGSLSTAIVEER